MSVLSARQVWAAPPGAPDPAVRGVSLEVGAGEWVALHGPNGGGKTTLALVLAGLWPALQGTVEFEGRPLRPGLPAGAREGIAVLLQDPGAQLLQSTVADELALAPRNLGRSEDEVGRELARVAAALGLESELERDPGTLSAGRQQMVLLGAALTARPRLLIADEAGAHLDPAARSRALSLVCNEVARGMAVLWVTQDRTESAAARRAIELGPVAPVSSSELVACLSPAGDREPALLTLEVAPAPALAGPRVATAVPRSFDVAAQGVTAFTGPNGAGKSVLLAAAAGALELPQVGVRWHAVPTAPPLLATQYPEHEIFEERVLDEVTWAAIQRGMPRGRARSEAVALLAALGCPAALAECRVWSLSGGEKRLVQLAGTLLAAAGLVVLDEPTAGLDPARRAAVATAVLRRARSSPVLVASQDTQWLDIVARRRFLLGA